MKRWLLTSVLSMALSGCITIATPPAQPVKAEQQGISCRPYVPPTRHPVPATPEVKEPSRKEDYVRYLEKVTEELAGHVDRLLDYIDEIRADEDTAVKHHLRDCGGL